MTFVLYFIQIERLRRKRKPPKPRHTYGKRFKKMFEMSAAEALLSLSESFPNEQPENLAQNDVVNNICNGPDSHSFNTAINQCPGSDKIKVVLSESSSDEKIVKTDVGKADMVRHSIWLHTWSKKCQSP